MTSDEPKTTVPSKEEAKHKARETADEVRNAASETAHKATSAARQKADETKEGVADEMSGIASALRTAAQEMRSGSPQERSFGQIAEGLADASDAVRDKDLSEMVRDVNTFARRNPLVFLGGAALVGFAATRFAKASSVPEHGHVPPEAYTAPRPAPMPDDPRQPGTAPQPAPMKGGPK